MPPCLTTSHTNSKDPKIQGVWVSAGSARLPLNATGRRWGLDPRTAAAASPVLGSNADYCQCPGRGPMNQHPWYPAFKKLCRLSPNVLAQQVQEENRGTGWPRLTRKMVLNSEVMMYLSGTTIYALQHTAWRLGLVVERWSRILMNEVTLLRARLVLEWVTVCGRVHHLSLWPATQANSAFYPQLGGKWVPAKVRWSCTARE